MLGQRTRILLTAMTVVCVVNLTLIGRSRSKPVVSPGGVEPGTAPTNSSGDATPVGFNRFSVQQREQESTIRNRSTTMQPTAPQARPVNALEKDQVIALVQTAIDKTARRYLDVDQYTPWQIMHGVLALRGEYKLKQKGRTVSGIDFVSSGPTYRGDYWWERTSAGGRGHPYSVPYHFEGHINQFPALLSMSALPLEHQLVAKGGTITVGDIVRNAQRTVNTNEELTWTLWLLTQYVDQNSTWVNQQGQNWSMAELVRLQVADGVNDAPCGGTHQLFALAFSRNAYLKQHGQLRGVWVNAEYKLRQYIELARQLQNADGSFSSNWFKGRGYTADFKERIKTSGHMLEWLMMALPASRLEEPWVRRAIQSVANDLIRNATAPAECGPMYHACHALVLYRERVAPPKSVAPQEQLAATPKPQSPPTTSNGTAPSPVAKNASSASTTPAATSPAPVAPSNVVATPKATIQDAGPKVQGNVPSQPGIVVLRPTAPGSTATNTITEEPLVVTRPKPGAPAMLMPADARPILTATPAPATAEPTAPSTPLVMKPAAQPVPAENPPADLPPSTDATAVAEAAMPTPPVTAPESASEPKSTLPSTSLVPKPESLASTAASPTHPADLPDANIAHPDDLPAADAIPASTVVVADSPAKLDSPILPQLADESASASEINSAGKLVIGVVEPAAGPRPSDKPAISDIPAPPTRVSEMPDSSEPTVR